MLPFGSPQWLEALCRDINASETYRQAAETWEGEISFIFESEPDRDWPDTRCALLDLWHGECRAARQVTEDEADGAPFVIRAPYTRWKQVVRGELDPIKGMMQGKLRLRGDLPAIVRYVAAAQELVRLAAAVPTTFPDEEPAS